MDVYHVRITMRETQDDDKLTLIRACKNLTSRKDLYLVVVPDSYGDAQDKNAHLTVVVYNVLGAPVTEEQIQEVQKAIGAATGARPYHRTISKKL